MSLFRFLFRYSPRFIILTTIIGILGGLASAAVMAIINGHLRAETASTHDLWMFAGLCLGILASNFFARVAIAGLAHWSSFDLRLQLGRKWMATPLRELESAGSARMLAAVTQDVESLAASMQALPGICIDVTVILACLIYLGYLSGQILLVMVGFLTFAVLTRTIPERRCEELLKEARGHGETMLETFNAMAGGIKELKMNTSRWNAFYSGELYDTSAKFRDRHYQAEKIYGLVRGYSEIIYFLFVGLLLYGTPLLGHLSLKVIVGFSVTLLYMKTNIDHVQDNISRIVQAQVALTNLRSLGVVETKSSLSLGDLRQRTARTEVIHALDAQTSHYGDGLKPECRRIEFDQVTFRYDGSDGEKGFGIGPINLTIEPGELLFLIGGNGSGKTTFAKLLCGLYAPQGGEVRLGGIPLTDESRPWYSQHFGTIFSDFYLFDKLYGQEILPESDDVVRTYLKELRLQDKVQVKDGCLSTISLSQGQRKRLALLTAYVENRPMYLFDEWAADQDPEFREVFYCQILPKLKEKGKTVIVISHDDRYYHIADRIVRLDGVSAKVVSPAKYRASEAVDSGVAALT